MPRPGRAGAPMNPNDFSLGIDGGYRIVQPSEAVRTRQALT